MLAVDSSPSIWLGNKTALAKIWKSLDVFNHLTLMNSIVEYITLISAIHYNFMSKLGAIQKVSPRGGGWPKRGQSMT